MRTFFNAFRATVICVVVDIAVLLVFSFVLGCNSGTALTTSHQARISEDVLLCAGKRASVENSLNLIKLLFADHGFMVAFVSAVFPFEITVIKRIAKH